LEGPDKIFSAAETALKWHGFAAGCVAVAVPRRSLYLCSGCAPGAGLALLCVSADSNAANLKRAAATSASVSLEKIRRLAIRGAKPAPGAQPSANSQLDGGAQPPPHIRRRSRAIRGLSRRRM